MSANNYLRLLKTKQGYVLSERDFDTDCEYSREGFTDLEQALAKAQEDQVDTEYGVRLVGFKRIKSEVF